MLECLLGYLLAVIVRLRCSEDHHSRSCADKLLSHRADDQTSALSKTIDRQQLNRLLLRRNLSFRPYGNEGGLGIIVERFRASPPSVEIRLVAQRWGTKRDSKISKQTLASYGKGPDRSIHTPKVIIRIDSGGLPNADQEVPAISLPQCQHNKQDS
jgi:hypothetical protein